MTSRTVLTAGFWLLAMGIAQAQLPVTDKAIILKTAQRELEIRYPQTGRADIDRRFADFAKNYAAEIEPNVPDPLDLVREPPKGPNTGRMSYKVRRNDAQMFSVQVTTGTYHAGRAHPMPGMVSFNFLMPEGRQIFLPELIEGQPGLDRVSRLTIARLARLPNLQGIDPQYIRNGASPHAYSFHNFVWLPDALEITYLPYEIAGYAQGTLRASIPLSQLAGVIRADPRAPAASFDCRMARSRIEKAICSDADLARLDRQVADRYSNKLRSHSDRNDSRRGADSRKAMQTRYEATVAGQRQWLLQRDKACASGEKACLTRVYQERERAL